MKSFNLKGLELKAIASALPDVIIDNRELTGILSKAEIERICNATGIFTTRVAHAGMNTVDLMYKAIERLLLISGFDINEADCLICVTQTQAFNIPGNAYVLCNKYGIGNNTIALDINAGCPGFTHGLITLGKMMDGKNIKNGILVVGDVITNLLSDEKDKLLYGDGASACLLTYNENCMDSFVAWKTFADKFDSVISWNGQSPQEEIELIKQKKVGNKDSGFYVDGQEIFCFGMKEVPEMINHVLRSNKIEMNEIDLFVFHQSNKMLIEYLSKKMQIPLNKVPIFLDGIGSTNSAAIPIALCRYAEVNNCNSLDGKLLLAGFGAGLSISIVVTDIKNMVIDPLSFS